MILQLLKLKLILVFVGIIYISFTVNVMDNLKYEIVTNLTDQLSDHKDHSLVTAVRSSQSGSSSGSSQNISLRIIVLAANRSRSLAWTLKTLNVLDMQGDSVQLDIWIDRDIRGIVDKATFQVAEDFIFNKGNKSIFIQPEHAGVFGQWINAWQPNVDSDEIALFLEDDVLISEYSWWWLKAVDGQFRGDQRVYGYTLQSDGVLNAVTSELLHRPNDYIYMYQILGSWGFAPKPGFWLEFLQWVKGAKGTIQPYVDNVVHTRWYKLFEESDNADSIWTMWLIYYIHNKSVFCVYSNIQGMTHWRSRYALAVHRREVGLHSSTAVKQPQQYLLTSWNNQYVYISKTVKMYLLDGSEVHS